MIELAWITGMLVLLLGASMQSVAVALVGVVIECVVIFMAIRG